MIIHQISNSGGIFNYNAFVYTRDGWYKHFHKNYEIIYVLNGSTQVYAGSSESILSTGECMIIPPNAVHSFEICEGSAVWVAVFSEDFIPQFAKTYRGEVFTKFVFDDTERTFLEENLFYQGTPERYMTIACLNIVCSQCVRHASMDKRGNEELSGRIIEYVLAHITEEMSMKSVAEDFGYEYHYFSAIFNKCIGMSFKDFLNLCRVERACELLNDASATLTHVALESGFQSIRNFDRVFKKLNGITPKEYMRMSQEKM